MKRCILALLLLLTLPAVASDFWSPYLELGTRTNGYRRGAGTMLWTPIVQEECWLLYSEIGVGHWWNNWALGVGLGYRRIIEEMAFGINGFLDAARTNNHFGYGQAGLGLEFFACGLDVSLNGYLPLEGHHPVRTDVERDVVAGEGTQLQDRFINVITQERTYSGFDISAGYCLPICGNALHVSAGYFYYSTSHTDRVAGPRLGAEYRIDNLAGCGSQLRVGGEYEYNRVFGNYGAAVVGIRVPLGRPGKALRCCCPCDLRRRLGDPVRRAEGILIREVTFRRSGVGDGGLCIGPDEKPVNLFYVSGDASESGDGTKSNPFNWSDAEEAATPYDVIALLGEGGSIEAAENFEMELGQIMVGLPGASCPKIITACGPLDVPLTKVRPSVAYTGSETTGDVITVADQTQIIGFDIDGMDGIERVIGGVEVDDVLVCNVKGCNTTAGWIRFERPSNIQILDSNFSASTGTGIFVGQPTGIITIDNNTISDIPGQLPDPTLASPGIAVEDIQAAATINVTHNSVDGTAANPLLSLGTGIFVESRSNQDVTVDISDNGPIKNILLRGIHVVRGSTGSQGGTTTVIIDGNDLENIILPRAFSASIFGEISSEAMGSTDPVMLFDIKNNYIKNSPGLADALGIHFGHTNGDTTATIAEGYIRNNTLDLIADQAIDIRQNTSGADHELTIEVDKNTIIDGLNQAIRVERREVSLQGILNATLGAAGVSGTLGNKDVHLGIIPRPAYVVTSGGGTLCLTMQGNTSDRTNPSDIDVTQTGGTLTVYRRDFLSSDNGFLGVALTGTIGDEASPCPTPSFP
jgi:Inverse autotransporter, beta-domain/Right handed beta helix region